jgi:2-isopropylmalate synthase
LKDGIYNRLIQQLDRQFDIYVRLVFPKSEFAIEDATRTRPEVLGEVVPRLVELGVDRIVIADTAGVATPRGIESIFDCIRSICKDISMGSTAFEFHGHNDRGLAVANSLQSILSGAQYVHGTMMGIGERNGNAALDTIILNLSGYCDKMINWESLDKYYGHCERLFQKVVENSYPYYGRNSYTSSTGTHCAAIKKAIDLGRVDISRNLFSPPSHLSKITDFNSYITFKWQKRSGRGHKSRWEFL